MACTEPLTLDSLLIALVVGQVVGLVVAAVLLPPEERWLAPWRPAAMRQVAAFGSWRAIQQCIRPSRVLTLGRVSRDGGRRHARFGQMEAGRVYMSPALLVVQGLGSYLFSSYAQTKSHRWAPLVRRADRSSLVMMSMTMVIGVIGTLLVPVFGHLITGPTFHMLPVAVFGWAVYAASSAAVMPYASLAAVRGRQRLVVLLRTADSVATLGLLAFFMFPLDASASAAPYLLAVGSFVDAVVIRWFILRRYVREEAADATPGTSPPPRRRASAPLGSRRDDARGRPRAGARGPGHPAGPAPDAAAPVSVPVLTFVWLMVISTVLAWRNEVYYSGGIDSVVLAKSAISVVAFIAAYGLWQRSGRGLDIGVRTLSLVSIYLAATVVGGWAAGTLLSAFVVAARVGLLGATLALLVLSTTSWTLMRTLGYALTLMAMACSLPALPAALAGARLAGGLFPLNANQIAMMYGVPSSSWCGGPWPDTSAPSRIGAIVGLLGLIWLTGSRTGLAATLLAVAIVIMLSERVPVPAFLGVMLAVPTIFYVAASTGLVTHYVDRGGASGNVANLNSRTIAWQAAFSTPKDFWQLMFGRGLSAKTVSVSGTYWDTQVLDSSWVSAYVQGGWVGLTVLGLWAALTLWGACRIPRPGLALWVALCVYCLLWSVTASGLLDSYVLFILMATTSLAGERTMRDWASGADDRADAPQAASIRG